MSYDVSRVRRRFPALASGFAHFDGPAGTQVASRVVGAMAGYLSAPFSTGGGTSIVARRTACLVEEARCTLGVLLDAPAERVVVGASMTQLTRDAAGVLSREWRAGDEIVLSRLDHDANLEPWLEAARRSRAVVRWVDVDARTGELPLPLLCAAIGSRTRLVALTAASSLVGTRPDVAAAGRRAREVGAWMYVDGVHLTPHAPVSLPGLHADFYVCSAHKFFGPHLGVLAVSAAAAEGLAAAAEPSGAQPEGGHLSGLFERGSLPVESVVGAAAAVEVLAGLAPDDPRAATGSPCRRGRLVSAMTAVEAHERELCERLAAGLRGIDGVVVHAPRGPRTPTLAFSVRSAGLAAVPDPARVAAYLAGHGVIVSSGTFHSAGAGRALGFGAEGVVRAGVSAYTDESDVARLLEAVSRGVADRWRTDVEAASARPRMLGTTVGRKH